MASHQEVELSALYREVVMDHYRNPRGREPLTKADITAKGFNPVCGDEVQVFLAIDDQRIAQAQVMARGCTICTASASMMAEVLPGKSLEEAQEDAEIFRKFMHGEPLLRDRDLGDAEALEGVKRFPVRIKCALLPWTTLKEALTAYALGETPGPSTTE